MAEQSLGSVLMSRANYHITVLSVHFQWTVGLQREYTAGRQENPTPYKCHTLMLAHTQIVVTVNTSKQVNKMPLKKMVGLEMRYKTLNSLLASEPLVMMT